MGDLGRSSLRLEYDISIPLVVNQGILEYLAEIDPGEAWEARGAEGKGDHQEILRRNKDKLEDLLDQNYFDGKVQELIDGALPLMNAFLEDDRDVIDDVLSDRDFYCVIGPPRTGGTYLYKEISRALDWPWDQLHLTETHDNMPYQNFINEFNTDYFDMGWRSPFKQFNFLFQMALFLIYGNRMAPGSSAFVLKHMNMVNGLLLLETIFGDRGHYLLTVRHPAAMTASRIETGHGTDSQQYRHECFEMWVRQYTNVLRDGVPGGLEMVQFGPGMEEYLEGFFEAHDYDEEPDGFRHSGREYDREFWSRETFQERMNWLNEYYALHGLEFPMPEKIL